MLEGVADPINFGMNACAGLEPEAMRGWVRFEDIRPGGYDPAARLAELDRDGVDAEVLYPTPRLNAAIVANPDAEYHEAMVRAYNDWLSEYVEYAPERFGGLAVIPNRGVEGALAEIDRVVDRPGDPRLRDGLLPERHARPDTRRRQGVRADRRSSACRSASTCRSPTPCPPPTACSFPGGGASSTSRTACSR